MEKRNNAAFAELAGDRMITDIGPACINLCAPEGEGLWCYLVQPTSVPDEFTVTGQCASCHTTVQFRASEHTVDSVTRTRKLHTHLRNLTGNPNL